MDWLNNKKNWATEKDYDLHQVAGRDGEELFPQSHSRDVLRPRLSSPRFGKYFFQVIGLEYWLSLGEYFISAESDKSCARHPQHDPLQPPLAWDTPSVRGGLNQLGNLLLYFPHDFIFTDTEDQSEWEQEEKQRGGIHLSTVIRVIHYSQKKWDDKIDEVRRISSLLFLVWKKPTENQKQSDQWRDLIKII